MLLLPLLGETSPEPSDARIAFLMFFTSILGGAVTYVVTEMKAARRANLDRKDKEEKTIVEHQKILIDRIDCEKEDLEKENEKLKERLDGKNIECVNCKASYRVARSHIRYLERILISKTLSFERYEDPEGTEGTDEHRALPPSPAPDTAKGESGS